MYLWLKALHIISMVTWFAGLFYLPRLFVYHADSTDSISCERFKIMERRLFILMTIGGVATAIFGLWLLTAFSWALYQTQLWLQLKLALVTALILYHFYCGYLVSLFKQDKNTATPKFYRFVNEIPSLFLLGIVVLVVVKPSF